MLANLVALNEPGSGGLQRRISGELCIQERIHDVPIEAVFSIGVGDDNPVITIHGSSRE